MTIWFGGYRPALKNTYLLVYMQPMKYVNKKNCVDKRWKSVLELTEREREIEEKIGPACAPLKQTAYSRIKKLHALLMANKMKPHGSPHNSIVYFYFISPLQK